jgi:mRNA-degrading endonuclease RelE of RelBE toxin-antitoxin system
MIRKIIETKAFTKEIEVLLKKRSLLPTDYEEFKKELTLNPDSGAIIVGSGGVRKVRLKSASRGKSGGFRVCYYFLVNKNHIYLLGIFAKNEQENLTKEEKNILKELVMILKGTT